MQAHRPNTFLLDFSWVPCLEIGAESDSASALTRGANDSIASLFAVVRCDYCKCRESSKREVYHTSEFSRIAQRPPKTDLSGGKASEDSFTVRRINLAVAGTVDFQFDPFSSAGALCSPLRSRRRNFSPRPARKIEVSEEAIRDSDRDNDVHIQPDFPLSRIDGADGEGRLRPTFSMPSICTSG